jgi:iron complex outermembrane receptor protein
MDEAKSIRPYFVQDLRLGYSLQKLLAKEINLVFQVNNVWNRKYEANGYTYGYIYDNTRVTENFYYPMASRNVMFAVNVKF